jgi:hypothetical protein
MRRLLLVEEKLELSNLFQVDKINRLAHVSLRAKEIVRGARSTFSMIVLGVIGPSLERLLRTIKALFGNSESISGTQSEYILSTVEYKGSFQSINSLNCVEIKKK